MAMAKRVGEADDQPELSRLEMEIMDVVWELGECSSAEVIAAYTKKRLLAPTTIRSVLANLRKKGYLEPVPTIERGFRLRALVNRDSVARRTLRGLVRSLFGGSPQTAIAYLLKNENIDEADLDQLRKLIDTRRGGKSK
jgi:BlaI family penicillinase repressor